MTAPNHALTGAIIGLTIHDPLLAMPIAFLSHFVCDAIPHYDVPEEGANTLLSARFIREQLVMGAGLCLLLVIWLAITRPENWLLANTCAFLAASPDLFWLPRFIHKVRTGRDRPPTSRFSRFHAWIQWKTGSKLWWTEALWAIACVSFIAVEIY